MGDARVIENPQHSNMNSSKATVDFIARQPLIALSGLGAAVGSVKGLMRNFRNISPNLFMRPIRIKRLIPRYMKSNLVKYPAMMLLLLITASKLRLMLNH